MSKFYTALWVCFAFFCGLLFFLSADFVVENKSAEEKIADELRMILRNIDYKSWEYKLGVFDCSNQTAYLYDFLSEKGYECEIVLGTNPPFFSRRHCWLIARKKGFEFTIESTFKDIVRPDIFDDFSMKIHFKSLRNLKKISWFLGLSHDWDY